MELYELLKESLELKARMDRDKARLAEVNALIAQRAVFPEGSKTGRVAASGYSAKVQLRETVSWDQTALEKALHSMGVTEFRKAFVYEYKPRSAKALSAWMSDPETKDDWRRLVAEAKVIKAGTPGVSVEYLGAE